MRQLEIARLVGGGRQITVITNDAIYHHAKLHVDWRTEQTSRFFCCSYSPALNPIKRVWKIARRNHLHNVCFSKLTIVIEVVVTQLTR